MLRGRLLRPSIETFPRWLRELNQRIVAANASPVGFVGLLAKQFGEDHEITRDEFLEYGLRAATGYGVTKAGTPAQIADMLEEEFEARWELWLDRAGEWTPVFERLQNLPTGGLEALLSAEGLVGADEFEAYGRLRRSAEGRAVPLPGVFAGTDADVAAVQYGLSESAATRGPSTTSANATIPRRSSAPRAFHTIARSPTLIGLPFVVQ